MSDNSVFYPICGMGKPEEESAGGGGGARTRGWGMGGLGKGGEKRGGRRAGLGFLSSYLKTLAVATVRWYQFYSSLDEFVGASLFRDLQYTHKFQEFVLIGPNAS
jgi:hypothetical protein